MSHGGATPADFDRMMWEAHDKEKQLKKKGKRKNKNENG